MRAKRIIPLIALLFLTAVTITLCTRAAGAHKKLSLVWTAENIPAAATQLYDCDENQKNAHWFCSDRNTGVWKSTDGRKTWTQINSGLPTNSSSTCAVGGVCGWTIKVNQLSGEIIEALQGSPAHYYISHDETRFSPVPEPKGFYLARQSFGGASMPVVAGDHMLFSGGGCSGCVVMYSTDSGATTALSLQSPPMGFAESVGINGSVYGAGGENGGFFTSTDGGAHFSNVWNVAPNAGRSDSGEIVAEITDGRGNWVLGTQTGVWQSSGSPAQPTFKQLYKSTQRTRTVYRDSQSNYYYGQLQNGTNPTIACSFDAGATWGECDAGIGKGLEAHYFVDDTNTGRVFAVVQDGRTNQAWLYSAQVYSVLAVSVTPAAASVFANQTQQFTATVTGGSGTPAWSVKGLGTISQTGLYTAPNSATTDTIIACANSVCGTATASVTIPITISVSPSSTSVIVNKQQQFSATVTGTTQAVTWSVVGSGTVTQAGLYTAPGSPETDQVIGCIGASPCSAATVKVTSNYDGPAELPRILIDSSEAATPAPGAQTPVSTSASIQTALNAMSCGDTLELQAGGVWHTGKITIPNKPCDDNHWLIIRTSTPDSGLTPEGTRINPCYFGVLSLPGRPAFGCQYTSSVGATIVYTGSGSGPFVFAPGANHVRFVGVEVTRAVGTKAVYDLFTAAPGVNHIVFDRGWPHGDAQEETVQAFGLDGMSYFSLVDSYATDFHCIAVTGTCTDSHVVGGGTSNSQDGPYKIVDNFIESSGEGILFGGGAATFTPADIQIAGNHFEKPLIWMTGQPGFVGGANGNPFIVKNHFELKNAQRVLFEGNILENVWGGFSQVGFSILLTPKSQAAAGGLSICPLCMVQDITIRYSKISHSGTGISIANAPSDNGGCAAAGERYSIHDITNDDINASFFRGNGGAFQVDSGCGAEVLNNVAINHVTVFPDQNSKVMSLGGPPSGPNVMYGFWLQNSIIGATKYPVWNIGGPTCASSDVPLTSMNTCWPAGYSFTNNALVNSNWHGNYPPTKWPTSNFWPTSAAVIDFMNFNGGNGGDYTLAPNSPYKNAGTDSKDLGADISAIAAATANAY